MEEPKRYLIVHKIFGYSFAALFLLMFIAMVWRAPVHWEGSSPRVAGHVALAVAVLFLLSLKILIPRYFRRLSGTLFGLGIIIYAMSFALFGVTGGYYIIRHAKDEPGVTYEEIPHPDTELGKELFITKCSTCHVLRDIMRPREVESWKEVINKMVDLAAPRITVDEGSQILYYLSQTHVPERPSPQEEPSMLEQHCLPCHEAGEIRKRDHSRTEWRALVEQMHEYAPTIVPANKFDEIVDRLVSNSAADAGE